MKKVAIIASTDRGVKLGIEIKKEFQKSILVSTRQTETEDSHEILSISDFLQKNFKSFDALVFIGALGICVRSIAPFIQDKTTDPAVVNIDDHAKFVQSVLSGHLGEANELAKKIARVIMAQPIITTSSDLQGLWALDTIGREYNWEVKSNRDLNTIISIFVNNRPTAIIFEMKDMGTAFMEKTKPAFADIYYDYEYLNYSKYELLIAVTYREEIITDIPCLTFHPKALHIGMGCSRGIEKDLLELSFMQKLKELNLSIKAVKSIASINIKADELALVALATKLSIPFYTYTIDNLNTQKVKNPSEKVKEKLGVYSVSEASAMLSSENNELLIEKQKIKVESGKMYTLAVAIDNHVKRRASIAIVGAGPGDPELISVKGKKLLESADLILYAGSLIPEALILNTKPTAVVHNSAGMTLEEQMDLMEEYYAKGHSIVRLQSGDPSIYGAIQEQMSLFEEKGMAYFIVPGISSFQAAAAHLKSEFTIPEVVQSIILTRGEGNTPLPHKEKLNEMAKHQATMCIFLSATIAQSVQAQLLEHYPPDTPIAVLYRVTWSDEEVYTGELTNLTAIIRKHKLTRTVLIIVGAAIGARKNRSQLYDPAYKHIFRTGKEVKVTL